METGIVRFWNCAEGWGVVDSVATPEGCWVHYSNVEMSGLHELHPGQEVLFSFEVLESFLQDGFSTRAITVVPR